ncbi:MAG: diguanylate cyclase [Gemmatimonadaceae bacterium]|nr:diguanylate cyclase [Gemmatimonadaceae bacterium]
MALDGFLGRALRDPATGLPNVPYLQLIRDWEERRARRRSYAVRVLKLTVSGGDERIRRSLAWRLIRILRDSDFIASQGPDHFEVLLTSPDAEHAGTLRSRIRKLIAELNERQPGTSPLKVQMEIEGGPGLIAKAEDSGDQAEDDGEGWWTA